MLRLRFQPHPSWIAQAVAVDYYAEGQPNKSLPAEPKSRVGPIGVNHRRMSVTAVLPPLDEREKLYLELPGTWETSPPSQQNQTPS